MMMKNIVQVENNATKSSYSKRRRPKKPSVRLGAGLCQIISFVKKTNLHISIKRRYASTEPDIMNIRKSESLLSAFIRNIRIGVANSLVET
jgi:hypothetical protein